jgi:hypothetical protein
MTTLDSVTIARRKGESEFDLLRSELLSQVQNLSANQWTDYNIHDPGITILEQLAYALSDVNYRMDYPVEEILANSEGRVSLEDHGLFTPEVALTCRPVSSRDLQRYLLDTIAELAYVEVDYSTDRPGFIQLRISSRNENSDERWLIDSVNKRYQNIRNLCENIETIRLIEKSCCEVSGQVNLTEDSDVDKVMTDVYVEIQRFLVGDVRKPNHYVNRNGVDSVEGPKLSKPPVDDAELELATQPRPMSVLVKRVMDIPGVLSLEDFRFKVSSNQSDSLRATSPSALPPAREHTYYLDFEKQIHNSEIKFYRNDKRIPSNPVHDYHELQTALNQITSSIAAFSVSDSEKQLAVNYPNLSVVSSVQSQFPSNYGINSYGVPAHSDITRKSQARQLQGYLLLFDQLMSDHLLMADHLKSVFSTEIQSLTSYPSAVVKDSNAYDLPSLYIAEIDNLKVPDLVKELDCDPQEVSRKSSVLNYLLAMNGRDNLDLGLQHLNPFYSERELEQVNLAHQKTALENIHQFSSNRGSGFNILNRSWLTENMSTLEKQVRLMLGVPLKKTSCLYKSLSLLCEELKGYPHEETSWHSIHYQSINQDDIQARIADRIDVPTVTLPEDINGQGLSAFLSDRKNNLKPSWALILQLGVSMDRYKLCQLKNKRSIDVLLDVGHSQKQPSWIYLASFKKLEHGVFFANAMRQLLLQENLRVEGVHLVEHLLLNPLENHQDCGTDGSFFCNQMTMVFPRYSTRFQQQVFRDTVLEFILRECPAHLHCHVLWLDHKQMQDFEILMSDWLKQLRIPESSIELSKATTSMVSFLKSNLGDVYA